MSVSACFAAVVAVFVAVAVDSALPASVIGRCLCREIAVESVLAWSMLLDRVVDCNIDVAFSVDIDCLIVLCIVV